MTTTEKKVEDLDGRDLDAAVARDVLDLNDVQHHDPPLIGVTTPPIRWSWVEATDSDVEPLRLRVPDYSGDVGHAWKAAEHLREQGFMPVLKHMPDDHPFRVQGSASEYGGREPTQDLPGSDGQAIAEFYPVTEEARSRVQLGINLSARADRPATAICRAALRTVREAS